MIAKMETEILQSVQASLRGFITKRVANEAEVDDLLQEVFLRMQRRINGLKDPQRMVSWLYQITRHVIIDYYRSSKRHREHPIGLAIDMESHQPVSFPSRDESGQLRMELTRCLRPMLDRLSSDYRDAVTLVEFEGLTQQAAAARLGLSLPGMKSRVQRGRKQIKRMLEECCVIQLDRRSRVIDYEMRNVRCDSCGSAMADITSSSPSIGDAN